MDGLRDKDPAETEDWLDSLEGVIEIEGQDRAAFLLDELLGQARRCGTPAPNFAATALNSIPPNREERHPGDRAIEQCRMTNSVRYGYCASSRHSQNGERDAMTQAGIGRSQARGTRHRRVRHGAFALGALLLSLVGLPSRPQAQAAAIVRTDGGQLRGEDGAIRAFRGIPYAAPPTGPLRWRPPQPAPAWQGVRDATAFGRDCPQPDYYPELRGAGQGEDCLTLNIWTSARSDDAPLPVMVWIYGGGFSTGSGSHPTYEGAEFARRGVVLVTLNYRLGLLGFMAHPGLTAESPDRASGNYGVMDQIAALQWIRRNIVAFGGDPNRVTIFGQSAGAMTIEAMLVSPLAQGLFQHALLQSVGAMRPMGTLAQAEQAGLELGEDLPALRRTTAAALTARLSRGGTESREASKPRPMGVIVDGHVVPVSDREAFSSGKYAKVPLIVGTNLDEGGGMARSAPIQTLAEFQDYLRRNFPEASREATDAYPAAGDAEVRPALARLLGDTEFNYGTRTLLRLASRDQPRVWRYLFTRHRDNAAHAPIHGAELQYVFGTLAGQHRGQRRPFDATDIAVSRAMTDAWVRFATTGDPNGSDLPHWPAYDAERDNYLECGRTSLLAKPDRCRDWTSWNAT
jgi:para-nitrobenzyl esterase